MNDIIEVCLSARQSEDETELDLLKDLITCALKYTTYRVEWNFYDVKERAEKDAYRTSSHNRFMDALSIFLRYESSLGKIVPDISSYDRKDLGDVANELVCVFAKAMR